MAVEMVGRAEWTGVLWLALAAAHLVLAADLTTHGQVGDGDSSGVPVTLTDNILEYQLFPDVFTPRECKDILEQFERGSKRELNKNVDYGISRTTYFAYNVHDRQFHWIYERVLPFVRATMKWAWAQVSLVDEISQDASLLGDHIDFNLLHEFGEGDFFDWHADTVPGSRVGRTLNLNVLLTNPRDFSGGWLQVGRHNVSAYTQGSLVLYPAAFPHRVSPITARRRYSLVIALKVGAVVQTSHQTSLQISHQTSHQTNLQTARLAPYWSLADAAYQRLLAGLNRKSKRCSRTVQNHPKLHKLYADLLFDMPGGRDLAEDQYNKAYALTSTGATHAMHFCDQGTLLRRRGHLEAALHAFQRAAAIAPRHPYVQTSLATTQQQHSELQAAVLQYRQVLQGGPEVSDTYHRLGVAYGQQGKTELEGQCYRTAAHLNPRHTGALFGAGSVLAWQERLDEALPFLQQAVASAPMHFGAYFNTGVVQAVLLGMGPAGSGPPGQGEGGRGVDQASARTSRLLQQARSLEPQDHVWTTETGLQPIHAPLTEPTHWHQSSEASPLEVLDQHQLGSETQFARGEEGRTAQMVRTVERLPELLKEAQASRRKGNGNPTLGSPAETLLQLVNLAMLPKDMR